MSFLVSSLRYTHQSTYFYASFIQTIISSVRESLRNDLVQSHLDTISTLKSSTINRFAKDTQNNNNDIPTLVLVLAVSGGCDSIALFHAILALVNSDKQETAESNSDNDNMHMWLDLGEVSTNKKKVDDFRVPCEVHVAHFNHEQRGKDSDEDESLVRKLCIESGIPIHTYTWSENTDDNNGFTQDTARQWRREKLKQLLSDIVLSSNDSTDQTDNTHRWGAILTAHHRDDADETILLKLLRGSHLTNLHGMEATSDCFDLEELSQDTEMKSAGTSSPLGYFAKPMLNLRKNEIVDYLVSNSLEWREDESNSSSKYKRNKIRNELIPLMSDIAGGNSALRKRISNLEQQSREISRDITSRSKKYLQSMPSNSSSFLLKDTQFDLVQEEALHLWIKEVTNMELQVSYNQMVRIRDQIHHHPGRLQWTLDVGSSWKIKRNGDTLTVFKENENRHSDDDDLSWMIIDSPNTDNIADLHELCFSSLPDGYTLDIKQVKDCVHTKFTPPWRRSAIKIKEFLRGQKVPLHLRDQVNVLCLVAHDDSSTQVLAVYLEGNGWIVDANFCPQDGLPTITTVQLQKATNS